MLNRRLRLQTDNWDYTTRVWAKPIQYITLLYCNRLKTKANEKLYQTMYPKKWWNVARVRNLWLSWERDRFCSNRCIPCGFLQDELRQKPSRRQQSGRVWVTGRPYRRAAWSSLPLAASRSAGAMRCRAAPTSSAFQPQVKEDDIIHSPTDKHPDPPIKHRSRGHRTVKHCSEGGSEGGLTTHSGMPVSDYAKPNALV